ncbi:hypothetical protein ACQ4PT_020328 [Festuca glaucescens]
MEACGGADAAADAKIGAVIGADAAESSGGAHGGAAGGSAAVVAVADLDVQKDLPVGDVPLPDLELKKAGDAVSDVKGDMQAVDDATEVKPVVQQEEDVTEDGGEPSKKRKFAMLAPYASDESSDGSLEYDSEDSAESVDKRNVCSFTRKLLQKLEDGTLSYVKGRRYFCPWHFMKPKGGELVNLVQHARELSKTGSSQQIKAEHAALLKVLVPEDDA